MSLAGVVSSLGLLEAWEDLAFLQAEVVEDPCLEVEVHQEVVVVGVLPFQEVVVVVALHHQVEGVVVDLLLEVEGVVVVLQALVGVEAVVHLLGVVVVEELHP